MATAAAGDGGIGFGYCPPPLTPACIDAAATYRTHPALNACEADVQRYIASVAAYRTCLGQETERAILQINRAVDLYRCRSRRGAGCPRP